MTVGCSAGLQLLERDSGLAFGGAGAAKVVVLAERKLMAPSDVAEETAVANGWARTLRHDLPLTKGLRALLGQADALARAT